MNFKRKNKLLDYVEERENIELWSSFKKLLNLIRSCEHPSARKAAQIIDYILQYMIRIKTYLLAGQDNETIKFFLYVVDQIKFKHELSMKSKYWNKFLESSFHHSLMSHIKQHKGKQNIQQCLLQRKMFYCKEEIHEYQNKEDKFMLIYPQMRKADLRNKLMKSQKFPERIIYGCQQKGEGIYAKGISLSENEYESLEKSIKDQCKTYSKRARIRRIPVYPNMQSIIDYYLNNPCEEYERGLFVIIVTFQEEEAYEPSSFHFLYQHNHKDGFLIFQCSENKMKAFQKLYKQQNPDKPFKLERDFTNQGFEMQEGLWFNYENSKTSGFQQIAEKLQVEMIVGKKKLILSNSTFSLESLTDLINLKIKDLSQNNPLPKISESLAHKKFFINAKSKKNAVYLFLFFKNISADIQFCLKS